MIGKDQYYRHAIDKNGNLIHVSAVTEASRYEGYHCVCCNGELVPVLGKKKAHHFRHKTDACSYESYIHKIWKKRIQERFYSEKTFQINYYIATPCNKVHSCKIKQYNQNINCNVAFYQTIDLKQEYDTCVEEFGYKGYVGDLVLLNSNHPEKEPLFIEIAYTHNCDEAKINTGIKIVEIKVYDDEFKQINLIEKAEKGPLNLNVQKSNPYDIKQLPDVRFYNFNRLPYPVIGLHSFVIGENGFYDIIHSSNATCKTRLQHINGAVMEIAIADIILYSRGCNYFLEAIMALGAKKHYLVRDCRLCNHKITYELFHRKCSLMTEAGFQSALQCKRYLVKISDINRFSERLRGVPYDIFE